MKNKTIFFLFSWLFVTIAWGAGSEYDSKDFGAGAIVGTMVGASGHVLLDREHFIQGAFAYNFARYPGLIISADYIWENIYEFSVNSFDWHTYFGGGGRFVAVQSGDDKGRTAFGARAPVGVSHILRDPHMILFGEVAPVLNIAPTTDFSIDLGIGFRVLF